MVSCSEYCLKFWDSLLSGCSRATIVRFAEFRVNPEQILRQRDSESVRGKSPLKLLLISAADGFQTRFAPTVTVMPDKCELTAKFNGRNTLFYFNETWFVVGNQGVSRTWRIRVHRIQCFP